MVQSHLPGLSCLLWQDFARGKLRLFVAAGLGLVALNAGSTAAFGWWYRKSGGWGGLGWLGSTGLLVWVQAWAALQGSHTSLDRVQGCNSQLVCYQLCTQVTKPSPAAARVQCWTR